MYAIAWALLITLLMLLPLAALLLSVRRRRRFWCGVRRAEVEVEFEERGLPGARRRVAVVSCSAFDPPTAVTCARRCLDASLRRLGVEQGRTR